MIRASTACSSKRFEIETLPAIWMRVEFFIESTIVLPMKSSRERVLRRWFGGSMSEWHNYENPTRASIQ